MKFLGKAEKRTVVVCGRWGCPQTGMKDLLRTMRVFPNSVVVRFAHWYEFIGYLKWVNFMEIHIIP